MPIVEITGAANGGEGVGRLEDGRVCFVPYALPGDVVRVEGVTAKKGVARGSIAEIVQGSPDRVTYGCPVFGRCGGCSWLHFAYPAQGEWKRRIVQDCLRRIGRVEAEVGWLEDAALRLGYRTRAEVHGSAGASPSPEGKCGRGEGGAWGFYEAGSREVVGIDACPLFHGRLNDAFAALRGLEADASVELTVNPETGETLAWSAKLTPGLAELFPNTNDLHDGLARHSFEFDGAPIVNGAFCQSSLLLNRLLVREAHRALEGADTVLDLYCGNGNLTLGLAAPVNVFGVDHNRAAIAAAQAYRSDTYHAGGEKEFVRAIGDCAWDAIVLDPPRTGAKAIMNALAKAEAGKIVYVACDPATLARDAGALTAKGWRMESVTAIDLFPNTPHVETVAVFGRV